MFVLNFFILQMRAIQSSHFVIPSARKTDTPRNHVFFDVFLRDLQLEPSHRDAQHGHGVRGDFQPGAKTDPREQRSAKLAERGEAWADGVRRMEKR